MDQQQGLVHGNADVVDELGRRRAGATLGTINHDEVRQQFRPQRHALVHRPGDPEPFPGMADGQLESHRLAAGQLAQAGDEFQQPDR